jgi:hypothetical protein
MKYSNIKTSVVEQFRAERGNEIVPFIMGAPGGGKSACARDIIKTMGIPQEKVIEFTASLRDPVDVLGIPNNHGDYTKWVAPQEFYTIRKGQGPCALILEELSDAPIPMQNALCRVVLDRHAGNLELSDQLFIIATGNRTADKSGANRITSKLANRTRLFDYTENVDDWVDWGLENDINPILLSFIRFRPALLSDFVPDRFANPTPRSWARVNLIPDSLDESLFFDNVAGEVGEGAAAEFTGFRRIYMGLPDVDGVLLDPKNAKVPDDPATLYALTGAIARKATKDNFSRVSEYLGRLPAEFNVMATRDAIKLQPDIKFSKAFLEWASRYSEVLM